MKKTAIAGSSNFRTARDVVRVGLIASAYLLLSAFLVGFKPEQIFLAVLFCAMYFISPGTRRFILAFSIFIVYWIIFDYMKSFPNYRYNTIHIESLYRAEKKWFGVYSDGMRVTPNEFWLTHGNTALDVTTGVFYLAWVPLPLLFAIYLFYTNRKQFFNFSLTFFWVNLIGFVVYYLYPAAPPWYVEQYGFSFHANTPGNTAGLAKFDRYFHAGIFKSIYSKSSNVFAAMPSLHSAYILIVLYFGIKLRLGWINVIFALFMTGIWFSAVYNSHHYVLDVLAGILCGLTGIVSFQWILKHSPRAARMLNQWIRITG